MGDIKTHFTHGGKIESFVQNTFEWVKKDNVEFQVRNIILYSQNYSDLIDIKSITKDIYAMKCYGVNTISSIF